MKNSNPPEAREVGMEDGNLDHIGGKHKMVAAREVAEDVSHEQAVKAVYPDAKIARNHNSAYYATTKQGAGGRISEYVGSDALAWKSARSKLKPEPTPTQTCLYCGEIVENGGGNLLYSASSGSTCYENRGGGGHFVVGKCIHGVIRTESCARCLSYGVEPITPAAEPTPTDPKIELITEEVRAGLFGGGSDSETVYPAAEPTPVRTRKYKGDDLCEQELHYFMEGRCTACGTADPNPPVAPVREAESPDAKVDEIITALYRRFKDWSKRGFSAEDVTWCEVKADVIALIQNLTPKPTMEPQDLPPLPASFGELYAIAGREFNETTPKDMPWEPAMVRSICKRMYRERQLLLALARAEKAEASIDVLIDESHENFARAEKAEALNAAYERNAKHKVVPVNYGSELTCEHKDNTILISHGELFCCYVCLLHEWLDDAEAKLEKPVEFTFSNLSSSTTTIDIETAQRNYGRHLVENAANIEAMRVQQELIGKLEDVVRWALGEGKGFPQKSWDDGPYYWRKELRRRFDLLK